MVRKLLTLLLSLTLIFAVSPPPVPAQVEYFVFAKREFIPTSFHREIYRMMERCTGRVGDFSSVRWFTAAAITIGPPEANQPAAGLWTPQRHIVLDREYVFYGPTVSHEILHDLYRGQAPMDASTQCILNYSLLRYKDPADEGDHY